MRFKMLPVAILTLCFIACTAPQTLNAQSTLNNDAVIKLVKAGLSEDLIISTINTQSGKYDTSTDGLIALKKAGISDRVVGAIVAKNSAPVTAGQNLNKVQEPEYDGIVFYLDPTGTLIPLERQPSNVEVKVKAMGFGGGKSSITYSGSKSPIRFKEGQDIQFVVRLNAPGTEPNSLVNLDVLKTSNNARSIVTMKVGAMGLSGAKSQNGETSRALIFSKYAEESFKLSPAKPLEPGEYVFTAFGGQGAFLFGIDPK